MGSTKRTLVWLKGRTTVVDTQTEGGEMSGSTDGKINMLIVLRGAAFSWTDAGASQQFLDNMSHYLAATGYDVLLPNCRGDTRREMQAVISWLHANTSTAEQIGTETTPWNKLVVLACSAGGGSFVQWLQEAPASMRVDGLISMSAKGMDGFADKTKARTCFTPSADNVVLVRGEHETVPWVIPSYDKFVEAHPGSKVKIVKSLGEEKADRAGHAPHASPNEKIREQVRDFFIKGLERFAAPPAEPQRMGGCSPCFPMLP